MENKKVLRVYGEDPCFYGRKISLYGIQHGRVDYAALGGSFDCILNNKIMFCDTLGYESWELVNGSDYDYFNGDGDEIDYEAFCDLEDQGLDCNAEMKEFFQYYIISDRGADILKEWTNETVWYNEYIDCYLWGVTHWGTSWEYVLTDIEFTKE